MVAVRGIAERHVEREGEQENERLRDLGAQGLGNETPTSPAIASTSTARATASARRS
jgi:hypothetical protein